MKRSVIIPTVVAGVLIAYTCQANELLSDDRGYMQGHPNYNESYYDYNYNSMPNIPNFNQNYYNDNKSSSINRNYDNDDNRIIGSDNGYYNPYNDRN